MARIRHFLYLILFCIAFSTIATAQTSPGQDGTSLSVSTPGDNALTGTVSLEEKISEMTGLVKKAGLYAKNNPGEQALDLMNDVNGEFVKEDLYLYAYDNNGTALVLPLNQDLIGTSRINLTDPNGVRIVERKADVAGYGGGYMYYVDQNPARNNTEQLKLSYLEAVDPTWFIGSGIFLPVDNAVLDKEAISGLVSRVQEAAAFGEAKGKETAVAAFNDKTDTWVKNNTYIFAYDFDGTALALPYQPESVGTNRWNYTDSNGVLDVRQKIDLARAGGGFAYVFYNNPETGKEEFKLCYVLPVDGSWMVGSGIYADTDVSDSGTS